MEKQNENFDKFKMFNQNITNLIGSELIFKFSPEKLNLIFHIMSNNVFEIKIENEIIGLGIYVDIPTRENISSFSFDRNNDIR